MFGVWNCYKKVTIKVTINQAREIIMKGIEVKQDQENQKINLCGKNYEKYMIKLQKHTKKEKNWRKIRINKKC